MHPQPRPAAVDAAHDSPSKWAVLTAVGLGTFMSALDISVINLALPAIQQTFNASIAAVEWVAIIYLLLVSGLLLSFGRVGDLYGHRRIYLAGFVGFILSSVLCGLAPSALALVALRAIQAVGAAMLSANSPAILTKAFPARQRGQALGLQATMTYLGLTLGPFIGGWLTQAFSWRAVFFINLPVGLAALALSYRFVPHDRPATRAGAFDWPGAILFMSGLTSLLLALNQGSHWGWAATPTLSLLAAAVVLLAVFVRREAQTPSPMLDLSLFTNREFSASTLSAILNYICVYSVLFLMPFYLMNGRGFSASQSGSILTAMPLVMAVLAPLSGAFSDRYGARLPATVGMVAIAVGMILLARLDAAAATTQIVTALLVSGAGIGVFISPNTSALMGAAPRERQGTAAGALATARNVGMVLGVGLAGAIFTTVLGRQSPAAPEAIFAATRAAFSAAGVIAAVGALTSAFFSAS